MIVYELPASPWWKDLLLAVPGIITALAAVLGVLIAKAGLNTWRRETIGKRKAELAEAILSDFYEAYDIIADARFPSGADGEGEGKTRERAEDEAPEDSHDLDSYYRAIERLNRKSELFAQLHARRYRYQAMFGLATAHPFVELFKIREEIFFASRQLILYYNKEGTSALPKRREEWIATLGLDYNHGPMNERLDALVKAVEETCRPVISEKSGAL